MKINWETGWKKITNKNKLYFSVNYEKKIGCDEITIQVLKIYPSHDISKLVSKKCIYIAEFLSAPPALIRTSEQTWSGKPNFCGKTKREAFLKAVKSAKDYYKYMSKYVDLKKSKTYYGYS